LSKGKYDETMKNVEDSEFVSDTAKTYLKELDKMKERWALAYKKMSLFLEFKRARGSNHCMPL